MSPWDSRTLQVRLRGKKVRSTSARRGRPTSICSQSHHCKTRQEESKIQGLGAEFFDRDYLNQRDEAYKSWTWSYYPHEFECTKHGTCMLAKQLPKHTHVPDPGPAQSTTGTNLLIAGLREKHLTEEERSDGSPLPSNLPYQWSLLLIWIPFVIATEAQRKERKLS